MLPKTFHQIFELTLRNYHTCVCVITFPSKEDMNLIEYTSHRRGIEPASLVMIGNLFKDFFLQKDLMVQSDSTTVINVTVIRIMD
jgi:hypothetical protein